MFLKTILIPVILTKAMLENFLHPPRNLMLRREILLPDLDSAPNGRPVQIMYNPDLVCNDSIFHVDEDIAQYFNKHRFKVLTNDQFKKIKETFSKSKIEFLGPPSVNEVIMASKSVRNNTGLLKGDSSLSKIPERLTYSTFPLLDLMQKIRSDGQLTKEEILTSLEQSIVLSSSSFASLSSVRRQRFRNVLAPEYTSLVNYDSETPSKFLLGDNIAEEEEKRSKKQRIIKKDFGKILFNRAPSPCQTINSGHSGAGATPSAKVPTNIKFIQKEELYSKEINNQDSKTKIQIKGRILKPPHGSNSFIFKNTGGNNSKQISFRHCKRLEDSFYSETNPSLPSTNPANRSHRGFTDQLRNLPSVRKGSNRRGGYVSTSLLKQPFPCCQTFRGGGEGEASKKSPTYKQIRSESKIQDGEHFTSERHFETKQFSHQNRLQRCFLQHPYRQNVKKIPSVYLLQQTLPIFRPTIRNFNSSSVFKDSKACHCSSPHKRHISHYLSRRSTHCHRDMHGLSELYKTSNFSSGVPGFSNQLRKIHSNPHPKARILGLHNRFNHGLLR